MEKNTFANPDGPMLTIRVKEVDDFNEQMKKWLNDKGLGAAEPFVSGSVRLTAGYCTVKTDYADGHTQQDSVADYHHDNQYDV